MGRPSKGERRRLVLRVPPNLHVELGHYSLDKDRDINEILLEVIEAWWEQQPERQKYQNLREPVPTPPEPATKKNGAKVKGA